MLTWEYHQKTHTPYVDRLVYYQHVCQTPSDSNTLFYALWMVARCSVKLLDMPQDIIRDRYLQCFIKFPQRYEPMLEWAVMFGTKKDILTWCCIAYLCSHQPSSDNDNHPWKHHGLYDYALDYMIAEYAYQIHDHAPYNVQKDYRMTYPELRKYMHHFNIPNFQLELDRVSQHGVEALQRLLTHKKYPMTLESKVQSLIHTYGQLAPIGANYEAYCRELDSYQELFEVYQSSTTHVPNIIHFIFIKMNNYSNYNFSITHYLAIRSAFETQKPDKIFFWVNHIQRDNIWFQRALPFVHVICLQNLPIMMNQHLVPFPQHIADIMRVTILKRYGGIYLDMDILSLRDFSEFRKYPLSLPVEDGKGLCNCVIFAQPKQPFLEEWCKAYEHQYGDVDDFWAGVSVRKPGDIANHYDVHQIPARLFTPFIYNDDHIYDTASDTERYQDCYTIHLWGTEALKYSKIPRTLHDFKGQDNTFTKLFSRYVREFFIQ